MRNTVKSLLRNFRKTLRMAGGYTLIEMAIVIAVAGVVIAGLALAYTQYHTKVAYQTTNDNEGHVNDQITSFIKQNGRYPCPARYDAQRTDPDYGIESECNPNQPGYPAVNPGNCIGGLCFENGAHGGYVRRGMLPFRSLNLQEPMAEDGFGMRLNYAVTESLAVAETYNKLGGGIAVTDGAGKSLVAPAGSAHFVLFSSGPDRMGAYTQAGKQYSSCTGGVAGAPSLDSQNCDTSPTHPNADYVIANTSTKSGATHFDDIVESYTSELTPLWKIQGSDRLNMTDVITSTAADPSAPGETAGAVSLGVVDPLALANDLTVANNNLLDVAGSALITKPDSTDPTTGHAIAGQICDKDKSISCFSPDLLTGNTLVCPPGQFATSIALGKVNCSNNPAQILPSCPQHENAYGINQDGTLACRLFDGCPSMAVTLCDSGNYSGGDNGPSFHAPAEIATIPVGQSGDIYHATAPNATLDTFGTLTVDYKCENGQWSPDGDQSGACHCRPINDQTPTSCHDAAGGWGIFTGSSTTTHTIACPSGVENWSNDFGAGTPTPCTCQAGQESQVTACPAGFTGSGVTSTRNFHCSPNWYYDDWVQQSSSCTCNAAATISQTIACPAGYTGSVHQKAQQQCPSGVFGPWTTTSSHCTCNPSATTQQQAFSCPPGQTGSITKTKTFDCASGTYGDWVVTATNCTVSNLHWLAGGSSSTQTGQSGQLVGSGCSTAGQVGSCSAAHGSGYTVYSGCTCN